MSVTKSVIGTVLVMGMTFGMGTAYAENGVTANEIVLGQSCALEGPAQSLGRGMKAGLLAAFAAMRCCVRVAAWIMPKCE